MTLGEAMKMDDGTMNLNFEFEGLFIIEILSSTTVHSKNVSYFGIKEFLQFT